MMNQLKTGLLLAGLTILFVLLGRYVAGVNGMLIAFAFALIMNVGAYWYSDKIVLGMYHAQPVSRQEAPQLYELVERLAQRAGLPVPRLYVIPDPTPNAFATGRNPEHGVVAVNQGLLQLLDHDEIAGVIAHELAHIRNRDTLVSTVAAMLAGAITMLANMAQYAAIFGGFSRDRDDEGGANAIGLLAMAILAPFAAMLLQMTISRSREYLADRVGAELTGHPMSLANALRKLELAATRRPMHANPATAHLFIVNPLRGEAFASLFSTHPSTQDRIARLEALSQEMGATSYAWR